MKPSGRKKHRHRYDMTYYAPGQKLWSGDYQCACGKVKYKPTPTHREKE